MKRVSFIKQNWNDEAERALLPALDCDRDWIKSEVEQGVSELFYCAEFGYCVTRFEISETLKELVLVAGSGKNLIDAVNCLAEIARNAGADRLRYHTHDWRVATLFEGAGFKEYERVFIKELKH